MSLSVVRKTSVSALASQHARVCGLALFNEGRRNLREAVPFSLRTTIRRLPAITRFAFGYGRRRDEFNASVSDFPELLAERSSPLKRSGAEYARDVQLAKEHNIQRVAQLLNGTIVEPGGVFSWHERVGPPLVVRGFARGPELQDGRLQRGAGGGVCQVANAIFWVGLHSGMAIVERYRHQLDLFPDHNRDVPFGCGATVSYPDKDLKLQNTSPHPIHIAVHADSEQLTVATRTTNPPSQSWSVRESEHRFVKVKTTLGFHRNRWQRKNIWRENTIIRDTQEGDIIRSETVARNRGLVCYDVPSHKIDQTCSWKEWRSDQR